MTYSESDTTVVGMNCRYPGVHNVAAFRTAPRTGCNILDPEMTPGNGHNHVTLNNVCEHVAELDANLFGCNRAEAETMDSQQCVFLICTWETFEQSGYNPKQHDARIDLYAGVSTGLYSPTHPIDNPDRLARLGGL